MKTYQITDLTFLGELVAAVARDEIMTRFERLAFVDARQKTSAFDVVTEADEQAEAAIGSALRARYPGASLIGEEAAHRDPSLLSSIDSADLAFIIDPLDGTKNFASGLPLFGVMVAVTVVGDVVAGVIHDPVQGACAYAMKGEGAWLERPDAGRIPLRVAAPVPVSEMHGIVGTNFLPEPMRTQVNSRLSRLATTAWFRCAAHEYRLAAAGGVHTLFYNKLMPWDHAAGWLLHKEAGGYSGHFDGSPYRPSDAGGGLICTTDDASFHAVQAALLE